MEAEVRTHPSIDSRFSGKVIAIGDGWARVALETLAEMAADEEGLVHGGFVFSMADFAAMVAVNEPTVVLAASSMEFLAPVRVGEKLEARATVRESVGPRHDVEVEVVRATDREERPVASGRFDCVVTRQHVLQAARDSGERE